MGVFSECLWESTWGERFVNERKVFGLFQKKVLWRGSEGGRSRPEREEKTDYIYANFLNRLSNKSHT